MTKIISLTSENVKRLTAVNITPEGNVVIIGGDNAQGKSSVLDSIAMALGGADEIPVMPVREGAEKAKIIAKLDNGIVIKRTFTAAGGTALVVETEDGAKYSSPQAMLDKLTGKLTFDPLAFTLLEPKQQAEALRKLVGIDFAEQDKARKKLYEERTLQNRQNQQQEALIAAMPFHMDAPAEEVNTAALMAELDAARAHNAQKTAIEAQITRASTSLNNEREKSAAIRREILSLEGRLRSLRETLPAQEENEKKAGAAHDAAIAADFDFKPIDETPIREALATAAVVNKKVQEAKAHKNAVASLDSLRKLSDDLTAKIEAIDKHKEGVLSGAKFPVAGLSFNESGVTFNGIPFSQASAAQRLRVSVAMAAALNPRMRVMLVRDGSLLDAKSMSLLAELAAEHNLQIWIERVGDQDKCAIVIEDGAVKAS